VRWFRRSARQLTGHRTLRALFLSTGSSVGDWHRGRARLDDDQRDAASTDSTQCACHVEPDNVHQRTDIHHQHEPIRHCTAPVTQVRFNTVDYAAVLIGRMTGFARPFVCRVRRRRGFRKYGPRSCTFQTDEIIGAQNHNCPRILPKLGILSAKFCIFRRTFSDRLKFRQRNCPLPRRR